MVGSRYAEVMLNALSSTAQLPAVCIAVIVLVSVVDGTFGMELNSRVLYGGPFESSSTIAYAEVSKNTTRQSDLHSM